MDKATIIAAAGRVPGLSKALRWYANRYPEGSAVTIKSGLAAGMKWRRHHRYVNGYWTGQYELPMQRALQRELKPGDCFYDVGANAGFFSLVAAKLVGDTGSVVSFDPDPDNGSSIREQIELNNLGARWVLENKGVADKAGTTTFERDKPGSPKGHLRATGADGFDAAGGKAMQELEVELVSLDGVLANHRPPNVIKMDIEGAEIMAIRGCERVLSEARPTWLFELHGPETERAVRGALTRHGYAYFTVEGAPIGDAVPELPRHFIARPS